MALNNSEKNELRKAILARMAAADAAVKDGKAQAVDVRDVKDTLVSAAEKLHISGVA